MQPRVLLGRLVQRACTPGVLESRQIGASVHAMRQLDCLPVRANKDLCRVICQLIDGTDARSMANVLHALALETRAQCDPHTALPAELHRTLIQVQRSLASVSDDLTAPESVMATEALLTLCRYGGVAHGASADDEVVVGGAVVQARLLRELQVRALALVHVVERPVELMGVLKIVLSAMNTPIPVRLGTSSTDVSHTGVKPTAPNREVDEVDDIFENDDGVNRTGMSSSAEEIPLSDVEELRLWGKESLAHVMRAISARLDSWNRQELLTLLDTLTVGSGCEAELAGGMRDSQADSVHDSSTDAEGGAAAGSGQLVDAARPLVQDILNHTVPMVSQLSGPQCAAWLTRLVRLGLTEHPLFICLVDRLSGGDNRVDHDNGSGGAAAARTHEAHPLPRRPASLVKTMNASQLATSAMALTAALREQRPLACSTTEASMRNHGHSPGDASSRGSGISITDQDACLRLFAQLLDELVALVDDAPTPDPPTATAHPASPRTTNAGRTRISRGGYSARMDVLSLVCAHVPKESLVDFVQRRVRGGAVGGAGGMAAAFPLAPQDAALVQGFTNTLARACAMLLRHAEELTPGELTNVACTVLHWHVFGGTVAIPLGQGVEDRHTSIRVTDPAAADARNHHGEGSVATPPPLCVSVAVRSGFHVMWVFPPKIASPAGREGGAPESPPQPGVRKLQALVCLLMGRFSELNMIDLLQLVNEATIALHEELAVLAKLRVHHPATRPRSRELSPSPSSPTPSGTELTVVALESLAMGLHRELQERFTRNGIQAQATQQLQRRQRPSHRSVSPQSKGDQTHDSLADSPRHTDRTVDANLSADDLPTIHLCRYLSSLSKLNIRSISVYQTILHLVQARPLTPFERFSTLHIVARHHVKAPYFLKGCVQRLPELAESLAPSYKAAVLKYLGQAGAQRFLRVGADKRLELGNFFLDEGELDALTYLECVFVFNGMVDLRQFDSTTLMQLLARGHLTKHLQRYRGSPSDSPGAEPHIAVPASQTLASVKSSTTHCEFVVSIMRLGIPTWMPRVVESRATDSASASKRATPCDVLEEQLLLLKDALHAAAVALSTTRSLFIDLGELTRAWPAFMSFTEEWEGAALALVPSLSPAERDRLRRRLQAVEAERSRLASAVQGPLATRIRDIANDPSLRPNSFLVGQLAAALCFHALPVDMEKKGESFGDAAENTSEEATVRLFNNVELRQLPKMLSDARQLVNLTVVGLHAGHLQGVKVPLSTAETLLAFVKKNMLSLGAADTLSVWWLCERAMKQQPLRGTPSVTTGKSADGSPRSRSDRVPSLAPALPPSVHPIVQDIRGIARAHFQDSRNADKLSPLERRMLARLQ